MSANYRYMTRDEVTTLLQRIVASSTDPIRAAWDAASDALKDAAIEQATADIDACTWRGCVASESQPLMWPRSRGDGLLFTPDPDQGASPLVAGLPRDVRRAVAIQSGARALRMSDMDPTAFAESAAQRGIVSQSGGGQSVQLDMGRALSPWSRLHPAAAQLMNQYRATGGRFA